MRFVLRIATSEQVMDIMFSVSGVVMCCISGQQLNGGYGVDDMTRKGRGRIHHIAIRNAVTEPVFPKWICVLLFKSTCYSARASRTRVRWKTVTK